MAGSDKKEFPLCENFHLNKVQNRQNFFNKAVSLVALSFCPPLTIKIFGKTDKRLSGGRIQQQTR
jgi:hypothetical protein